MTEQVQCSWDESSATSTQKNSPQHFPLQCRVAGFFKLFSLQCWLLLKSLTATAAAHGAEQIWLDLPPPGDSECSSSSTSFPAPCRARLCVLVWEVTVSELFFFFYLHWSKSHITILQKAFSVLRPSIHGRKDYLYIYIYTVYRVYTVFEQGKRKKWGMDPSPWTNSYLRTLRNLYFIKSLCIIIPLLFYQV